MPLTQFGVKLFSRWPCHTLFTWTKSYTQLHFSNSFSLSFSPSFFVVFSFNKFSVLFEWQKHIFFFSTFEFANCQKKFFVYVSYTQSRPLNFLVHFACFFYRWIGITATLNNKAAHKSNNKQSIFNPFIYLVTFTFTLFGVDSDLQPVHLPFHVFLYIHFAFAPFQCM